MQTGALSAGMVTAQQGAVDTTYKHRGVGEKNLRLRVLCLLLHDLQDHFAGSRAALRGGVDADGFFCSSCVLLTVNINPASTALMSEWAQGRGSAASQHVLAALLLQHPCRLLKCKLRCTQERKEQLILGSTFQIDTVARSPIHRNPSETSESIYFKQHE